MSERPGGSRLRRAWKIVGFALLVAAGLPVVLVLTAGGVFYAMMSSYAPNRTSGTIISSGQPRSYLLYVPASYDASRPTPLVISLHGAALWPSTQMEASQWNRAADQHGFIVVYPAGTTLSGAGHGILPFRVWMMEPDEQLTADVTFIAELMDTLAVRYRIDPARIYATGLSNGGGMVFGLACRLSGRIAAVGTVAAAQIRPAAWCSDTTPMPMITFHGTGDRLVPYHGAPAGLLNPRPFPDVEAFVAAWARRNGCGPVPVDSAVAADVIRTEFRGCRRDAAVVLYAIQGGGHTWPGGKPMPRWLAGPMTSSIDATTLMWAFFRRHPR